MTKAARIRSYMEDSGMSRAEAKALVDFEGADDAPRARLKAQLKAAGYKPGDDQRTWEQHVAAAVDPIVDALKGTVKS